MLTLLRAALAAAVLGGAFFALPVPGGSLTARARPFTVEDLLNLESLGAAAADPSGRRVVFEQRDPYASAARFDLDRYIPDALSRLMVVDLDQPGPARRLLPDTPAGQLMGAFSPDGGTLAVFRFADGRRSLGVVEMASGRVRWFPLTPELPVFGRALQWRSENRLLVLDRSDGVPSWPLRLGHASAERLPALWAAAAEGRGARTVLGSGAFRDLRPRPATRRLVEFDVMTGAVRTLAEGEFTDFELSPDGRRVAVLESGEDLQPTADRPVQGDWGVATQVKKVSLLDLATCDRRAVRPDGDVLPHLLSWSPDSSALLVFSRGRGAPWREGRLQRIDAATGDSAPIGATVAPLIEGRPEVVRAGWMGSDPVVFARPAATPDGRLDWYRLPRRGPPVALTTGLPSTPRDLAALGPKGLVALSDGNVWRIDRRGRAERLPLGGPLTDARGPQTDVEGRAWFAPPAHAYAIGPEGVLQLSAAGARPALARIPTNGRLLAVSVPRGAALVRELNARGVTMLSLLRDHQPPLEVARLNAGLADTDPLIPHPVSHPGPEGQPLISWLFLPADRSGGGRPPPLVVRAYAGSGWRRPPLEPATVTTLTTDLRTLVGHGYAVLVPSLPRTGAPTDPMADLGPRILAIVDTAAHDPALAGAFDPDRLALWGHSYGGYTVMAAIGQTDRFAAAVSISGISDLTAKWGAIPPAHRVLPEEGVWTPWSAGSVEDGQGGMGGPPWRDPQRYIRNSPLFAAGRITTPLLLMHGDQDGLPIAQSEAMFSALWRQDHDAVLVTYWGEGHYIGSPGNLRDLYARAFAFLDRHLTAPAAPGASPAPAPASSGPRPRRRPRRTARWRQAARRVPRA